MPDASAVNRAQRLALLDDGSLSRFSLMLDDDGDETDDPEEACVAICPTQCGRWLVIDLSQYTEAEIH